MANLTLKFCKEQANRIIATVKGGQFATARTHEEISRVLFRDGDTEAIVERAVTLLLDDPERALDNGRRGLPEPGELVKYVEWAKDSLRAAPVRMDYCGKCDRGWVRVTINARGIEYSAVVQCVCQGGKADPEKQQRLLGA